MARFYTLIILICCFTTSFAQEKRSVSYLVIEMHARYDYHTERDYYLIQGGDPAFPELNQLVTFDPRSNKKNIPAAYFASKSDSTQKMYNYFRSVNEALLFLGEEGWELVSVNNNISSEAAVRMQYPEKDQTYTNISSKPVFYFKRALEK